MSYDLLTKDQMVAILSQRKLELEADHYAAVTENKLAKTLDLGEVEAGTQLKADTLQKAIDQLDAEIEALQADTPPVTRSRRQRPQ